MRLRYSTARRQRQSDVGSAPGGLLPVRFRQRKTMQRNVMEASGILSSAPVIGVHASAFLRIVRKLKANSVRKLRERSLEDTCIVPLSIAIEI